MNVNLHDSTASIWKLKESETNQSKQSVNGSKTNGYALNNNNKENDFIKFYKDKQQIAAYTEYGDGFFSHKQGQSVSSNQYKMNGDGFLFSTAECIKVEKEVAIGDGHLNQRTNIKQMDAFNPLMNGKQFEHKTNGNLYSLKKLTTTKVNGFGSVYLPKNVQRNDKMNGSLMTGGAAVGGNIPPRFQYAEECRHGKLCQVKQCKFRHPKETKCRMMLKEKEAEAPKRHYKSQPINNSKNIKCCNESCVQCNRGWIWVNAQNLTVLRSVIYSSDRYRNERTFYCRFGRNLPFIRYDKFKLSPSHFMYSKFQNILVCGECDFSLTASLVIMFGGYGSNIVSTSWYRYKRQWLRNICESVGAKKFLTFRVNKEFCEANGVQCVFGVDAKKLDQSVDRWNRPKFGALDVVLFTFPRIYSTKGEWSTLEYFEKNENLLREVLKSAKQYLSPYGEIHIMALLGQLPQWGIYRILDELDLEIACWSILDEHSLKMLFSWYSPRDSHGNFMNLKEWEISLFAFRRKGVNKPRLIKMNALKQQKQKKLFKSDFCPIRIVRMKDVESPMEIIEPNPFKFRLREFECVKFTATCMLFF